MRRTVILGASRGLGSEIARICRKDGYTFEISSSGLFSKHKNQKVYKCNLASLPMVMQCADYIKELEFDDFFWVAGQFDRRYFEEQSREEAIRLVDVNFRNAIFIVHEVWKIMQRSETPGNFVVISSKSGIKGGPKEAIYDATKYAQVGLTRGLGLENKNPYIHVSLILPGGMKTDMQRKLSQGDFSNLLEPAYVARRIITAVSEQQGGYGEYIIS